MSVTIEMEPSVVDEFFNITTNVDADLLVSGIPATAKFSIQCNSNEGEMIFHLPKKYRLKFMKSAGRNGKISLVEKEDSSNVVMVTINEITSAEEVG